MLILVHELHAAGLDVTELWNKVIRRLENDPNKTGPTIPQHLDKLRQRVFEAGGMIPPWNGRDNCPTVSQEFRGVLKCPKRSSEGRGWRDVTWDEELEEEIDPDVHYNTSVSCISKTVDQPGKKSIRKLTDAQMGFSTATPVVQRKNRSLAGVVVNNDGTPVPHLKAGYSVRGKSQTQYAPKAATKSATKAKPKRKTASKAKAQGDQSSEDEGEQQDEEDGQQPLPAGISRRTGRKMIMGGHVRGDSEVKPQGGGDDEEDEEDEGVDGGSNDVS